MTLKIATIALTDEALARMLPYGVAVAGASGITVTFPITGTTAMGAGTLSVSSVSDATIANHTHAITSSSNPDNAASILATDSSGILTLDELIVTFLSVANNLNMSSPAYLNVGTLDADSTLFINNNIVGRICNVSVDGTIATNMTGIINVAAGENLILTKGLTVSGNSGELAFSVTGSIGTIPESMIFAGRNVANIFTAAQTITLSSALALKVNSTTFPNQFIVDTLNGYVGVNGVPTDTQLQVFNYAVSTARGIAVDNYMAHAQGAQVQFRHSRGSGTHIALAAEDVFGLFAGYGSDGYGWQIGCSLKFACESIPASGTMAGYMAFFTRAAGGTNTDRGRVNSAGNWLIGTSTDGMTAAGSLAVAKDFAHRGTKLGVFNATPIVRTAAYTLTNRVDDRILDCDSTSTAELADVLATVIYDLQQYGFFQ